LIFIAFGLVLIFGGLVIPNLVWTVGFAREQLLNVVVLASSDLEILKQLECIF
jgi:hypothetical protein